MAGPAIDIDGIAEAVIALDQAVDLGAVIGRLGVPDYN